MASIVMFAYGVLSYVAFLATLLYLVAFVGDFPVPVPVTVDRGLSTGLSEGILLDLALLTLFAAQHSVMARPGFKRMWTRIIPEPVERSTFVLAASAVLALILWQWRPIPAPVIWQVSNKTLRLCLHCTFWLGWVVLLISSYLINHFELFGLSQVYHRLVGRVPQEQPFRTPFFYRQVRHPIYLGFLIGFWSTPTMTAGHLLFASGMTLYILLGIYFEERDLINHFGERYRSYRARTGMLLPRVTKPQSSSASLLTKN